MADRADENFWEGIRKKGSEKPYEGAGQTYKASEPCLEAYYTRGAF